MANNINWGKIYDTTYWGVGVTTNTISWGKTYSDLSGVTPSFALDFNTIADDFTFTRNSFATRVDENGLIETVTNLGSELISVGNSTQDLVSLTTSTTVVVESGVTTTGKSYKVTFEVYDYVEGAVYVLRPFDIGVGNQINANGIYTFYGEAISPSVTLRTAGASTTLKIRNISVKEVIENDIPRIDYSTGEGAFLLEPQSTNLIAYSEDVSGASNWNRTAVTSTQNATTSLDGTQNADLIQSTGTSSCIIDDNALTFTIGNTYTFSVFAKKGNNDWIRLGHVTSGGTGCWFDLENGVVGTVNSESATIEDYGNGWYRCTNTFVATQTTGSFQVFIGICDADGSTNSGASGQNDYVWGMQVEALPYATSYIPTNGSTVTRAAESCVDATPTINSEEGVLYAEISALADDITNRSIGLTDGSTSNRVNILYSNSTNQIRATVVVGGSAEFDTTYVLTSIQDNHKIALKYKENDFALWIDGVEINTDLIGSVFAEGTLTKLNFNIGTSLFPFYGNTKDLRVYDKALTDEELTELTTI